MLAAAKMTSFEQVMPDYPMAEQADEMMDDSGELQIPKSRDEDFDLDLTFEEDGEQDEHMAEDDFQFGDDSTTVDQIGFDKDDEMADDDQQNQSEDHEIQDAPQETKSTDVLPIVTEVPMGEPQNLELFDNAFGLTEAHAFDFGDEFADTGPNALSEETYVEHSAVDAAIESIAQSANDGLATHVDQSEGVLETNPDATTEDEVSLNTSEESGTVQNPARQDGSQAIPSGSANDAQEESNKETSSQIGDGTDHGLNNGQEHNDTNTSSEDVKPVAEGNSQDNSTKADPLKSEVPSTDQRVPDAVASQPETSAPVSIVKKNSLSQDLDEESKDGREVPKMVKRVDDLPDDWHPMVLDFNGQEMSLFMPSTNDNTGTFLLSDYTLVEQDLNALLQACRLVLGADLEPSEDLVLTVHAFGLEISERTEEATTTSLVQLRDMYINMAHNDGLESPGPLQLGLYTRPKVSRQLDNLRHMIEQGKGLKDLAAEYESGDDEFASEEPSNFDSISHTEADEEEETPHIDANAESEISAPPLKQGEGKDQGVIQDTDTLFANEEGKEDLIDFGSPVRRTKNDVEEILVPQDQDHQDQESPKPADGKIQPGLEDGVAYGEDIPNVENSEFDKYFPEEDGLAQDDAQENEDLLDGGQSGLTKHYEVDSLVAADIAGAENELSGTSSTLQGDETEFLAGEMLDCELIWDSTDWSLDNDEHFGNNTDNLSLHGSHQATADDPEHPEHVDLGFDFNDYAEENLSTTAELSGATDPGNNKSSSQLDLATQSFEPTKAVATTNSANGGDAALLETEIETGTGFEFDEIDFPDDEELESHQEQDDAAVHRSTDGSRQDKVESLKRPRPTEDDLLATDASPSKFVRLDDLRDRLMHRQTV